MRSRTTGIIGALSGLVIGAVVMWGWHQIPKYQTGTARVIDGDNIEVGGVNVRLAWINAAELPKSCRRNNKRPECDEHAFRVLKERVEGKEVSCTIIGIGMWRRPLGICYFNGKELNMWLVKNCLVGSPRRRRHRAARYQAAMCDSKRR